MRWEARDSLAVQDDRTDAFVKPSAPETWRTQERLARKILSADTRPNVANSRPLSALGRGSVPHGSGY